MQQRVAIIGAGVIGLLSARLLLQRGVRVLLLDRQMPARAASWAGGGIVSPLYPWLYADAVTALANDAQVAYAMLSAELRRETGIDPEYNPCGLLMMAPAQEEAALAWCRHHRRRVLRYTAADVSTVQSGLAEGEGSALWMPEIGNVRNPRLLKALLAGVLAHPLAECRWNVAVGIRPAARGAALRVNGEPVGCDAVLLSAGAWSAGLLAPLGVQLPIEPVRGQMLLFAPQPGLLRSIVLSRGRYLIPRRDGRILVGSTLERCGFNATTTPEVRDFLRGEAVRIMPALAKAGVERHWAGLRPGAPGGIPFIDRVPGTSLVVNAGHYRNGLVLAPAAASLGVSLLLGESPALDPSPYALTARRPAPGA